MSKKVRIKKIPQARGGGMFGDQTPPRDTWQNPGNWGTDPEIKIKRTLEPTSREHATLEAELGETVITNLQDEGIPEFYKIGGKPHSKGGTPLNLPEESFIFSNDKKLAISNPAILKMFGKNTKGKKAFTPADISKQYDLNEYREILIDPYSSKLERETAERMIRNYNLKLGALSLAQESQKGFDRNIPKVAFPYIETMGIDPNELLLTEAPTQAQLEQFKGGGSYTGKRKVKIKSTPYYDNGGGTSKKPTRRQNIPDGVVMWDTSKEGYNPDDVGVGDYVKKADGKWYKVTSEAYGKFEGEMIQDDNLGKWQEPYSMLNEKFKDPKLRKALYDQYKAYAKKLKPRKNLSQDTIDAMLEMTPDQVVENFLRKQRVNLAINNKLGILSEQERKELWDTDPMISTNVTKELGYEPFSKPEVAAFQTAYAGFNELLKDPKYKGDLAEFQLHQAGVGDEEISGVGKGTISQVDSWDGNTTSGQLVLPTNRAKELQYEEAAWEEIQQEGAEPESDVKHMPPAKYADPGKYWTQDLVNLSGAVGDFLTAKKYDPWQAVPEFEEATPTFTDFRGAAARVASQARGLGAAGAAFSGPQSQGALHANLQRGMVDPILKLQEQENQTNVGVANQFEMFNTQSKNQFNTLKAKLDTDLYDKQVMANQNFDNTKRALAWNMRKMFNNAWTNKGKTQVMNSMRDDYFVDPRTGYLHFRDVPDEIEPDFTSKTLYSDQAAALMRKHPGLEWKDAAKLVKLNAGYPVTDEDDLPGVNSAAYMYPGGQ